jgi:hypothetical protein
MSATSPSRRGLVLFAVLVIVGSAVLVATTVVFLVGGEVAGGANEREVLRVRAAGLSAVQAVAARLASQRSSLLEGGTPLIDGELVLWESGDETATARLVPLDAAGATLVAENAKIPLTGASLESLVATGAIDESLAGRLLALRDGGPKLGSVDALAQARGGADGLTPVELFGPLDRLAASLSVDPRERRDQALEARVGTGDGTVPVRDLLTALSYEPPLRADGSPRLRLDVEWTDDHRGGVDAALGSGSSVALEAAMKEGEPTLGSLFAAWRVKHAEPKEWHAFLDGVTLGDGPVEGRIDVMRASAAALRALPGITREIAERIVREREGLPSDARRSIAWLAERSILTPDECAALVERATTRSVLWRVRVVATITRAKEIGPRPGVVFEAVIDCSEARPRIAALRDFTGIDTVAAMLLSAPPRDASEEATSPSADANESGDLGDIERLLDLDETADDAEMDVEEESSTVEPGGSPAVDVPGAMPVPARRGAGRWRPAR